MLYSENVGHAGSWCCSEPQVPPPGLAEPAAAGGREGGLWLCLPQTEEATDSDCVTVTTAAFDLLLFFQFI